MIQPHLRDEALLSSIAHAERTPDEPCIWWLGQSGFLVVFQGARLLLDPYLSDSLTEKYAATSKPHVRMTALVIAPERLPRIDAATSSHNHTDHLDAQTLLALRAANPRLKLVFPEANRPFVSKRLGFPDDALLGLDDGAEISVGPFQFHGVAAAHPDIERDSLGRCHFLGCVVRFGKWKIYHSGDTLLWPGLAERVRTLGPIDLALLPINGDRPERGVAGNLDGAQAARLAFEIGTRCVVPCHYEMFEFNTADPRDSFIPECTRLGQLFRVLRAGEPFCLSRGIPCSSLTSAKAIPQ